MSEIERFRTFLFKRLFLIDSNAVNRDSILNLHSHIFIGLPYPISPNLGYSISMQVHQLKFATDLSLLH